jgi:hypothetical protein
MAVRVEKIFEEGRPAEEETVIPGSIACFTLVDPETYIGRMILVECSKTDEYSDIYDGPTPAGLAIAEGDKDISPLIHAHRTESNHIRTLMPGEEHSLALQSRHSGRFKMVLYHTVTSN